MTWTHTPVTILGLSKSGVAVARYLVSRGAQCFLSDVAPASAHNKPLRDELEALGVVVEMGGHSARCFSHADLVVVSPGIPPSSPVIRELTLSGKEIISEVELAARETTTPLVAITGTNGKTTTTTLISTILEAAGYKAPACGNIGTPVISLVDDKNDFLVTELSSFQLAFSPTLKAKVALMMNFRPDHLDWHGSEDAYREAKFQLFVPPHTPEWSVLLADDPVCEQLGHSLQAPVLWFSRSFARVANLPNWISLDAEGMVMVKTEAMEQPQRLFPISVSQLPGAHNQENVLAAAAACFVLGVSPQVLQQAVSQFQGVAHRLERVACVDGVWVYNDSKATNPDATLSALCAFAPQKVVLIAGGRDKKTDLSEFVESVKCHAAHVVLIGEAADRFEAVLQAGGYPHVSRAQTLESAITVGLGAASAQVPLLFSPACASFDMFKNFEDRGDSFKTLVCRLAQPTLL